MSALSINQLSLAYQPQVPIFNDLSFHVEQGQKVLVTGLSGTGKSSFLHAITGCIPNHIKAKVSGDILLFDKPIQSYPLEQRIQTINIIFQQPHWQFVSLTVLDELAFGLGSLNVPKAQMINEINEIIDQLGLNACKDMKLHQCSLGQQQVIACASILLLKPKILCMDEALSAVESSWKKQVLSVIQHKVKTLVIVDHQPDYHQVTHHLSLSKGVLELV